MLMNHELYKICIGVIANKYLVYKLISYNL